MTKIRTFLIVRSIAYGLLAFHFSLFTFHSFSQSVGVSINNTGAAANSKAMLDVDATGMSPMGGVLVPRMTTIERNAITTPIPESLLIYNTDTHCFEAYYNGVWVGFGCLSSGCQVPVVPTAVTNTASQTSIVWNWSDASSPVSYKWGTTSSYSSATNNGTSTSYTQNSLTCNTSYTAYVWAYNACGNSSYTTLTQSSSACCAGSTPTSGCGGTYTLVDARGSTPYVTYTLVEIGTQCWMAQNLNYGTYEALPGSGPQPSGYKYCQTLGGANDATCAMGGLYEWANMMQQSAPPFNGNDPSCNGDATCPPCTTPVQGLCPNGWHVPSHYEWTKMENAINSSTAFPYDVTTTGWLGTNEGASLKSTTSWTTPNCCSTSCTGGTCNSSGFNALPGGFSLSGSFNDASINATFWSGTEKDSSNAWSQYLDYIHPTVYRDYGGGGKADGFSVRCVKD